MTDIAELHAQALDATGRIVCSVAADRWHAATPCAGWDAHALVNHLVAGNLWAAELAAGGTIEGVGGRLDGDLLGEDPAAAYGESAVAAAAVFRRPGALDAPCAVSYGPVPGSVYAGHRFLDVLVHGWDLAVATGQDCALDPHLMEACRQIIEPQLEAFRGAGALGPEVAVPADASAQTRFLALLGRAGGETRMHTPDPILAVMDRFTAAINAHDLDAVLALVTEDIVFESTSPPPDGARYEGRAAVAQVWGDLLASTPKARFAVEEQFSDGSQRAVVRWRYDWSEGHVRGVDIVRIRDGQLAESLAYVKG